MSSTPPETRSAIAQTPEAIRKKLESAVPRSSGASTFESKELSATIPPMPSETVKPVVEKKPDADKRDLAQTPEEIRKKLQTRQESSSSSGKASFDSKDIEPAGPQDARLKHKPDEHPKGKAIFESKDLSSPDEN